MEFGLLATSNRIKIIIYIPVLTPPKPVNDHAHDLELIIVPWDAL